MSKRSPFNKRGKLRIALSTDPWWKRALSRLRGYGVWHQMGAMRDE
ncbi:hypothetical protein [Mycobacterium sp. PSTR-4-N]|nr:hypothetical protein [Mycobacterium sp. PSTR-4-N]MCG7596342.1 hypothetical protein [Mycobacterium sp. PSTR-4-N]